MTRPAHLLALLALLSGCSFDVAGIPAPTYVCTTAQDCSVSGSQCIQSVCAAEASVAPYPVILRVLPPTAAIGGVTYTFDATTIEGSAQRDLAVPPELSVVGVVRYADHENQQLPAQITFARSSMVEGTTFADGARLLAPMIASDANGAPVDFRVAMAGQRYVAVVTPTTDRIPAGFQDLPSDRPSDALFSDLFPPLVVPIEPPATPGEEVRVDVLYGPSLFQPCEAGTAEACTATGRVVSDDGSGALVPEAGVSVVLESTQTLQSISTTAVTDADGRFTLRISSIVGAYHLRFGPSTLRPAYPSFVLADTAFDPPVGGDVITQRFDVVRYTGKVEQATVPSVGAVVRAIASEVDNSNNVQVFGATFETSARTDASGYFTLDLIEGDYGLVAFDTSTNSSLVLQRFLARRSIDDQPQQGQVFRLGSTLALAGRLSGPDGQSLGYASVQALPAPGFAAPVDAFARVSAATSDSTGAFNLLVDTGSYDLVFASTSADGLPMAVLLGQTISAASTTTRLDVVVPSPVVLYGRLARTSGAALPGARLEAHLLVPKGTTAFAHTVLIGTATADVDGSYRLLLPSALGPAP